MAPYTQHHQVVKTAVSSVSQGDDVMHMKFSISLAMLGRAEEALEYAKRACDGAKPDNYCELSDDEDNAQNHDGPKVFPESECE